MSMLLTAQAMKLKIGNPARKLVLLKLADNANDKGECFPSYQHIAEHCEISRQSAITHINALIEMGLVTKKERKTAEGNTSNLYLLHLEKGSQNSGLGVVKNLDQPSQNSGLGVVKNLDPEPVNINQSINHTPLPPKGEPLPAETKKSQLSVEVENPETVDLPDYVNRESWVAYCQMRKAKRSAIKTRKTLELCLRDLEKHSGGDPKLAIEILEQSTANCWTGIFALKTDFRKPSGATNAHDKSGAWAVGRTINVKVEAMR
ncbi:helix-turn-helix domain-containing protein [Glaesserella sp.]|uniref:helix-turn-helix domain-containing protein n=1 Tax=Glaesserella sp. TaxID=2094731 RepID=UPI00359FEACD